jgi:starvation-inducible outer membrane lipoprotein
MNTAALATLFTAAGLLLAGCASTPDSANASHSASLQRHCKVVLAPAPGGKTDPSNQADIDRAEARARLAASSLRLGTLRSPPGQTGLVDDILRDC